MHLLAIRIDGETYRDREVMNDEEFEFIAGHPKRLPRGVVVFHKNSSTWDKVLAYPVYHSSNNETVSDFVAIHQSEHGACRWCQKAPASGLFVGKFADYDYHWKVKSLDERYNKPARLRPYRGYLCEACANEMECGDFVNKNV